MVQIEAGAVRAARDAQHPTSRLGGEIGAGDLGYEWKAARGAQVAFDDLDKVVLGQELHVERACDPQGSRKLGRDAPDPAYCRDVDALRRQHERRVTAGNASILDVLADRPEDKLAFVGDGVDLNFPRVRLELRDDDGMIR